ncbi:MAG: ankyrin repeat domain-containing protein [Treponema sp.]|nr:ankyrin repeat domain-containing protein [Treponema sp.]
MKNKDIESTLEYTLAKEQTIVYIYESVTKDYIYKTKEMEQFYEQIKDIVPSKSDFFINWFKGFVEVAKNNFDEAKKLYNCALDKVSVADEYTVAFLQQGFALFMYLSEKKAAEKFWNYGQKEGLFAKTDSKFFETFNPKEQFWVQFAPNMFVNKEEAFSMAIKDYKKKITDKVQIAIEKADFKKFSSAIKNIDLNTYKIAGISPLYYAIQFKGTLSSGKNKFIQDLVNIRTQQMLDNLDFSILPEAKLNECRITIFHQMRQTYEKSGLGEIMFSAYYAEESQIETAIKELNKIIKKLIEIIDDPNSFVMKLEGKMGTTALFLAAEIDDSETVKSLLDKGCDVNKFIGYAKFGMNYKDGKSIKTEVPNSLIYRLINFSSYKTLKMYLTDYSHLAKKSMTEKTEKCNITPLVYMILNTIYNSKNEAEYNEKKKILDSFIPLFQQAGSVLDENTAFGTAKELLGLK